MEIKDIYKSVIKRTDIWDYYNKGISAPNLSDAEDCCRFITEFMKYSEKTKTVLFDGICYLKENDPWRLNHIVSTFFLGLWFFRHNRNRFIHNVITKELGNLNCFQNNIDDIDRQFTYIWFMATLFHDLGYIAENKKDGEAIPSHRIPYDNSVPDFYSNVYEQYYNYREKHEHGIFAGLKFDRDICDIRNFQEHNDKSNLSWRKELEQLYHYVAWIILAHNIWMIRDDEKYLTNYQNAGLKQLILSSEKVNNKFVEYKIKYEEHPLFVFFCIIDTIEPLKSTNCLSKVDIQLKGDKIIVKSNDTVYRQKVKDLNKWLTPTIEDKDRIIINLKM